MLALVYGSGCHGPSIDPGPGDVPLSEYSANVSAGDLLDPGTAASRLGIYLDELSAAGYRKQIRIILPPDWGTIIYEHWFPPIRSRGFKVLAILGQEKRDTAADVPKSMAWMRHILPLVRHDLIGVQIVNEPAHGFTPAEYAEYHRQVAPLIRRLAAGVPIVAGDFGVQADGKNNLEYWKAAVATGLVDYDILSIHPTGVTRKRELDDFAQRLLDFAGPERQIWITEGDWGQLPYLRERGLHIEEAFVYTWNDDVDERLIRRPGGRLAIDKSNR